MAASAGKFTVKLGAKKLKIWKVKITKNYRRSTVGVARWEGKYGVNIDLHGVVDSWETTRDDNGNDNGDDEASK